MYYFLDIFVRDVSWYVYWEAILIGVLVATSLYFFTKNKWGSLFLGIPISAAYLSFVHHYSYHLILISIHVALQYLVLTMIEECTLRKKKRSV
ncbi:hypothetical protein CN961_16135 [Bacillus thuringiensis]|uniref:Uncharacterized protein n=1 Tax=Bacillus thuringiensis TaxID=1428 RepID=A0A9X6YFD1_BACTU|nr:hypothetical protein B4918_18700 [Bacillus thuringiensis]EPF12762.1 hypothetical protein ICA_01583 [Bacillus cereus BAG1O-3]KXX84605.1 hypothetical protein AT266_19490 [Bacillus cereus]OJE49523.1 hypothetical protein BAQ48_16675 [Bacillus luti]OTZ83975.1 hypothetical protein BK771_22280 [Bacillus thuringiensis serovar ostriniae]PFG76202.1 hypothetical protein DL97_3443 [Bacillus sp. YF23]